MINAISNNMYSVPVYNSSKVFDYSAAVNNANKQALELLESLQAKNKPLLTTVGTQKSIQKESTAFLNAFTSGMKSLDASAEKFRGANLDKLLYNKDGAVTDITAKNTVGAVKDMVAQYNSTLNLLNKNADRGTGVVKQIGRMVSIDPASEENMAKIGLSVNKDGTLKLDEDKLESALKTEDPAARKNITNILGGRNGVADTIQSHTRYGSTMSSRQLVGNDVQKAKDLKQENPFYVLYQQTKGNVYALNDMAYTGMFLDMKI